MKRRILTGLACTATALAGLTAAWITLASAATAAPPAQPGTGQALEIGPPIFTLTADPGQVINAQINLRDISGGDLVVTNQVNDFIANGEDGTPKILLNESQEDQNPLSIKGWVSPIPELTLLPGQIKTLPVTITVPSNASPGGHFGVIRFTGLPPGVSGNGVSLSASLGSLLLIRVNGAIRENISVQQFTVSKNGTNGTVFEGAPLTFVERIKNSGNLQEQPTGNVSVTDMFGRGVGSVNVNLQSRYVLPDSIRRFTSPFDSSVLGNKKLFGLYHAKLHMAYGQGKITEAKLTFWIIPWRLIIIVIVILVGGFFLLRYLIRRYNRSIINRSQGGGINRGSKRRK